MGMERHGTRDRDKFSEVEQEVERAGKALAKETVYSVCEWVHVCVCM